MKKLLCMLTLLLALVCALAACNTETPRSITKSEIVNGELVLTYSDGTTENLGKVVGDDGEKGEDLTDDNPQGLDFYPLPDGTYAVSAGKASYLENIIIPATYKGAAVSCIGLLPGMDNDPLEMGSYGGGFIYAPNLQSVTIPASVTHIGHKAFSECPVLETVTFAEGSQLRSIDEEAFYRCESLTSITIPASVESIGDYVFSGCSALTSITVEDGNTVYYSAGNCLIETASKTLLFGCNTSVIPTDGSVTSIGSHAFYYCKSLTSIEIPASVTSIGHWAFYNCQSLSSVTFENKNGWKADYTSISATDLADPAKAATHLKSTYMRYNWTRTEE